eukprot:4746431-Prymnesium_polylepis.1
MGARGLQPQLAVAARRWRRARRRHPWRAAGGAGGAPPTLDIQTHKLSHHSASCPRVAGVDASYLHNGAAARVEVAARGAVGVAGAAHPCASTRPLPSPAPAAIAA